MISRLVWMETDNMYPYRNLATKEYMTLHVPQGTCILYLWQNRHTVVIGKNQNCWRECRVNLLEQENGYLVRRLSGGDTVFRDLGNLNFTFTVGVGDYDASRQSNVMLEAARNLGIHVERTGHNNITADGRKFSDNAFYRAGDGCYHRGTILVRAGKENMSRYLSVSKEKLVSKGMTSVKSRVINLCGFKPDITLEEVESVLVEVFSKIHGQPAVRMEEGELPQLDIDARTEKFASWQRKYGRKISFGYEMEKRFSWGNIQIQFHVDEGMIQDVSASSDVMDQEMIGMLAEQLKGCACAEEDICRVVKAMGTDVFQAGEYTGADEPQPCRIKEGIITFVRESL